MSTHTHILSDLRAPYEEKYELYFILKDIIKSLKWPEKEEYNNLKIRTITLLNHPKWCHIHFENT
jgi:hypothetical protein